MRSYTIRNFQDIMTFLTTNHQDRRDLVNTSNLGNATLETFIVYKHDQPLPFMLTNRVYNDRDQADMIIKLLAEDNQDEIDAIHNRLEEVLQR